MSAINQPSPNGSAIKLVLLILLHVVILLFFMTIPDWIPNANQPHQREQYVSNKKLSRLDFDLASINIRSGLRKLPDLPLIKSLSLVNKKDIMLQSDGDNDLLRLLAFGDWGKGGLDYDMTKLTTGSSSKAYTYQAALARQMSSYYQNYNLRAVIALGDNFYNDGVTSTSDSLWSNVWQKVYMQEDSSLLGKPWYAVLGNHDYGSRDIGVQAQIDKYNDVSVSYPTNDLPWSEVYSLAESTNGEVVKVIGEEKLWNMPSQNYSRTFDIPGGGSVQIVFIDTTTLAPSLNKCCNQQG